MDGPSGPRQCRRLVLSIALFCLSMTLGDGMSLLATVLLSGTSVLVGVTNRWEMKFRLFSKDVTQITPGDTVIRWPNASMLIVRCSEELARVLFFSPEKIDYTMNWPNGFIFLSLLGTLFLMASVIALANAKIQLQIAWALSFVVLNIAHWFAAALPRKLNWDFSEFVFVEHGMEGGPHNGNYTEALFRAIVFTQSTDWVRVSNAAPKTAAWDDWLADAKAIANTRQHSMGRLPSPMWGTESGSVPIYRVDGNPLPPYDRGRINQSQSPGSSV